MSSSTRGKAAIVLTAFLDFTGFAIISPVLAPLADKYGASLFATSLLASAYALVGLVSAPVAGALSDRLGRKKVLFSSVFLAAVGWAVMAWAPTFALLFLGRMIGGLAFGNVAIVQAMLGDLGKDAKERTMNLALFGIAVGLAFIAGPLAGGWLAAHWNVEAPLWFAAGLSLVNAACIWFLVPETAAASTRAKHPGILESLRDTFTDARLRPGLLLWTFAMAAMMCYQSVLPLILDEDYQLTPDAIGYVMAALGMVILVNQGAFMRPFWLKRTQGSNMWVAIVGSGLACAAIPLGAKLAATVAGLCALSVFQGVFRPVANNLLNESAPGSKRGEVNGVASSAMTLTMVACPALGGWLLEHGVSPFWAGAAFFCVAALFIKPTLEAARQGRAAEPAGTAPAPMAE